MCMIPKHVIKYMAGFFDGEGSLYINKQKHGERYKLHPYYQEAASIYNTRKEPLLLFQKYFSGILKLYKAGSKYQDYYFWRIVSRDAVKFCEVMKDELLIKKQQAKILIKLHKTMKFCGRSKVPNKILKRREALYLKIQSLNH